MDDAGKNANYTFDILDKVRLSIPDQQLLIEVLESIHKVFQNIIDNPLEGKYRKLKIGSKFYNNYIAPYSSIQEFLLHAKFYANNDFLTNDAPVEEIQAIFNDFINYAVAFSNYYNFLNFLFPYKNFIYNDLKYFIRPC